MHLKPQYTFVCYKGEIAVDYWGKYEELDKTWKLICKKINQNIMLPWLNKSNDKCEYKSYYTEKSMNKVKALYKKDIELFDYVF
jgi:hypothetical protein